MMTTRVFVFLTVAGLSSLFGVSSFTAEEAKPAGPTPRRPIYTKDTKVQAVIDEVDKKCRHDTIYMVGPEKARRLAELVRRRKPKRVVECGTAIGYSGLWIARELKAAGAGKLITIEINPQRAQQARQNFKKAGLENYIEVKVGDARKVTEQVDGPIDFAFIDCGASNYYGCLKGLEKHLAPGAVIVADNAGISAAGMKDYLEHVRGKYTSHTEWFDVDLPWAKRDAIEISVAPPVDVDAESATHEEIEPLGVKFKRLAALRLAPDGKLLACDADAEEIKVIDPAGKLLGVIHPGLAPEAIDIAADGSIYCGGQDRLARLDATGRIVKSAELPETAASPVSEESRRRAKVCNVSVRLRISGIAVTERDVFVAFGSGWSLLSTSKLYRFDRNLENAKLLVEGLRGCCQRCDVAADGGGFYVAENSVHRVVRYDSHGKVLDRWGQKSRTGLSGFGACCNPMNLCIGPDGAIYTAESGLGRVKRYAADGKLLDLVGYVGVKRFERAGPKAASCSNIAIAVTPDGKRVYVIDYTENVIRVLQKKA